MVSVFLCSCLFSAASLIIASKITTLNGFIIASVLPELLINVPAFAWVFGFKKSWLLIHPGVAAVELLSGGTHRILSLLVLTLWSVLFFLLSVSSVEKMLKKVGGAKL
jgi:fluoroquinolone transport system permease protein